MTAIIAALGWKVLAAIGGLAVLAFGWWRSLSNAKATGVATQQAADAKQRENDLVQANQAAGAVSSMDDTAVLAELHRAYDRRSVPVGPGDQRRP